MLGDCLFHKAFSFAGWSFVILTDMPLFSDSQNRKRTVCSSGGLWDYNFTMKYCKDVQNSDTDALSQSHPLKDKSAAVVVAPGMGTILLNWHKKMVEALIT